MICCCLIISCSDDGTPEMTDPCEGIVNGEAQGDECVCIGNFTGDQCDTCIGNFTGDQCDTCIENYTGDNCDIEVRSTYYGTWSGMLSGCTIQVPLLGDYDVPEAPVTLTVTENGTDLTKVSINFFITGFADENIVGTIDGNSISIDPFDQMIDVGLATLTVNFSGDGNRVSETQIDMTLKIDAGAGENTCPLTLTKG